MVEIRTSGVIASTACCWCCHRFLDRCHRFLDRCHRSVSLPLRLSLWVATVAMLLLLLLYQCCR